jgi:hypothetical protein
LLNLLGKLRLVGRQPTSSFDHLVGKNLVTAWTSGSGLVSRVTPVHTALRNCTGDEGGLFWFGDQVADPKLRKRPCRRGKAASPLGQLRILHGRTQNAQIVVAWLHRGRRWRGPALAGGIAVYNTMAQFGGFFGPIVIGVLKQETNSYAAGLIALAVAVTSSAVVILALGRVLSPRAVSASIVRA